MVKIIDLNYGISKDLVIIINLSKKSSIEFWVATLYRPTVSST